jgi:hypothetical protein
MSVDVAGNPPDLHLRLVDSVHVLVPLRGESGDGDAGRDRVVARVDTPEHRP